MTLGYVTGDLKAEMAVLGSCLVERDGINAARQFVLPEHFGDPRNGNAFRSILALHDKGIGIDIVTLADELRRESRLTFDNGAQFLGDCINAVTTASHAAYYAQIVARFHYEREIQKAARLLAENPDGHGLEALASLFAARGELQSPQTFDYATSLPDALEDLENPKKETVYRFNFPALDSITDGLKKGEVATFGAATNQGKSVLLLNLMDMMARDGMRSLFVGSEMTARETFARHLSMDSGIDAWKIRLRKLSDQDQKKAYDAVSERLHKLPIAILDDPEPTLERIEATIAREKPDAVFLDYLERMSLPPAKDLRLSVKEFMRRLKNIARKRNVVILLASQLNRNTYRGEDAAPTLADLSESSAIEKESDRVFLIWRPKMLQPDPAQISAPAVLEIIKAKDRHGRNGLKAYVELDSRTLRLREVKNDFESSEVAL